MSLLPSPIPPRRAATNNPIIRAEPPASGEAWLARALGRLAFAELNQWPVQQNTQSRVCINRVQVTSGGHAYGSAHLRLSRTEGEQTQP